METKLRNIGASELAGEMFEVVVKQLDDDNAIHASHRSQERNRIVSRHLVLHGIDVEYGTEENALRCIQLLDFVADTCVILGKQHSSSVDPHIGS